MLEDQYIATGYGRCGVDPNINHFSQQRDNFIRARHGGFLLT